MLSVQVTAVQDWNDSTSINTHELLQSSLSSYAKDERNSCSQNKTLVHYTGPNKAVALLTHQLRQAKQYSALQLQALTAVYGQEGAAAMQLMPKSRVHRHKPTPKVWDLYCISN